MGVWEEKWGFDFNQAPWGGAVIDVNQIPTKLRMGGLKLIGALHPVLTIITPASDLLSIYIEGVFGIIYVPVLTVHARSIKDNSIAQKRQKF